MLARRVPRNEDLFHGNMAPGQPSPDGVNETVTSFCLCDGSRQCGRKATSDTTADASEPQRNILLGVPKITVTKRRRKRQTTSDDDDDQQPTGNARTYATQYE